MSDSNRSNSSVLAGFVQLGKYFQLVSIVPAGVVVLATYSVVAAGAPMQAPDPATLASTIRDINLAIAAGLASSVLILAMMMHPFQFAWTQALEGYWGPSSVGQEAMLSRARIHLDRRRRLAKAAAKARLESQTAAGAVRNSRTDLELHIAEVHLLRASIRRQEALRALDRYPSKPARTMPTGMGNRLRHYEDLAGERYGIKAVSLIPHLLGAAPDQHAARVDDARVDLDLAVRFTVAWLLTAVLTFSLLVTHGAWLIIPLGAYGLAWVSYRGAVRAADDYGHALIVFVDMNHGLLQDLNRSTVRDRETDGGAK